MTAGGLSRLFGSCLGLAVFAVALLAGCAVPEPERKPVPSPVVERGAALYEANCQSCHGGATGGSMMDMPPRHNANGHTWHHPDCQLTDVVLNGSGEMGEMMRRMMGVPENLPRMPAFRDKLSREDIVAILAHIKTWWTEEQRRQQAQITEQRC